MRKHTRLAAILLALALLVSTMNLSVFAAVPEGASVLTLDKTFEVTLNSSETVSAIFTPTETNLYAFTAENAEWGYESGVWIYDTDGEYVGSLFVWGYMTEKCCVNLTAGETYVLEMKITYGTEGGFRITPTVQPPYEYTVYTDHVEITNCYLNQEEITIPATLEGLPVTEISNLGDAVYYVEKLTLPDSVTTVDRYLLCDWGLPLKELHLGSGLAAIDDYLLRDLDNLEKITVSANNPSFTSVDGVLYNKDVTKLIKLPVARTTTHRIPDTVTDLNGLFNTSNTPIPHVLTGAGTPEYKVVDNVVYDTEMETIYSCAAEKTGSFTVPESVYYIGSYALSNTAMSEIKLTSVVSIAYGAFSGSAVKKISIPDTLRFVGEDTFYNCGKLEQVNVADLHSWCEIEFMDNPLRFGDLYMEGKQVKNLKLPTTIEKVYSSAFTGATFESVSVPANVKSIGRNAFLDATIGSIKFEEGIENIEYQAFAYANLTSVTLPDSLEKLSDCAFYSSKLEKVTFGSGMHTIESETFYNTRLTNVVLPENISYVDNYAFLNCGQLNHVTFENDAVQIGSFAFYECPLWEIDLDDNVYYIGERAFYGNSAVTVTVPKGVTEITYRSFADANNMISVVIPETVKSIDPHAFEGNSRISHVLYKGTEAQWKEITSESFWDYETIGSAELNGANIHFEATGDEITVVRTCKKIEHYCAICDKWETIEYPNAKHNFVDGVCTRCNYAPKDGWVQENGKWYFYEKNTMVKNDWRKDSIGWCYLTADGSMATNKWIADSKGWCYVGADGYCWTNCWAQDSVGWVWLDKEGSMVYNQWILYKGKWYFVGSDGYMVTNEWRKDSKGWCWLTADGSMATNQWVKDSKGWCYIGADGYCWTNCWAKDSVGWVYLDKEGSMVYNKWIQDGGKWYYVGADGYMLSNTSRNIDGKVYKFNASGVCTNP